MNYYPYFPPIPAPLVPVPLQYEVAPVEIVTAPIAEKFPEPAVIDYGPHPYVADIERAALANRDYREALWTGRYLQLTLMNIPVGGEVGLEVHPDTDQFFCVEAGTAMVQMGERRERLHFRQQATAGYGIFIPAGMWHNIVNSGHEPLKMYSVYAPPHHPPGTRQATKAVADAQER
jgi:mannose-6-phosphate isomerase-like protein (cupin superfamily)